MLESLRGCRGYDEYDYAVIIHRGCLLSGRRPVICRMFPVFRHHTMLTYFRRVAARASAVPQQHRPKSGRAGIIQLLDPNGWPCHYIQ